MRSLIFAAAAASLVLCQAVSAQTNTTTSSSNNGAQTYPNNLRSDLRDMLKQGGYTNIRVMPSSFVIRAKDKNGNPVMMMVSPDSFTQLTEMGTTGDNDSANLTTGSTTGSATDGNDFVSVPQNSKLSSNFVGLDVYNSANKDVGTIKDLALDPNGRVDSYIVSVGGFLGMGEHYVAVKPRDLTVTYNDSDKKWHATMNASTEQLKSAPEFKYSGRWSASHT
jgi:sporulation protein YlmC with PRC-barrel domain